MAFVVDEDERGEIFHGDFPHRFHSKFRKIDDFLRADMVLSEQCRGATRRSKVESAIFLACIRHLFRAISLGQHDHRAAVGLEKIDVTIHTTCGGWAERAGW